MRNNVKFSNGDPVKADDFIFSWNRAARMQGDYATVFQPVAGYDDVSNGKAHDMTGLKKIDDYSFSATLSSQAGYWYTEVALWTAWVVDQKVIKAAGKEDDQNWASDPATAIGTGPFKMTARTPKQSTDFAPVPNWWGGSTGAITKVHIEIIADGRVHPDRQRQPEPHPRRRHPLQLRRAAEVAAAASAFSPDHMDRLQHVRRSRQAVEKLHLREPVRR